MFLITKTFIKLLALTVVASSFRGAHCFLPLAQASNPHRTKLLKNVIGNKPTTPLHIPRGGGETEMKMAAAPLTAVKNLLFPALQSGPYGIAALFALSTAAVVPLTLYKQLYAISAGYGLAIFSCGLALQRCFQPAPLSLGQAMTAVLMFYGIRLAGYLFVREATRKTPSPAARKESGIFQKLTLAVSVSLFYACLSTPILYALRNMAVLDLASNRLLVTKIGIGLAFFGVILEAVADLQKYIVKQSSDAGNDQFQGPIGLTYRLCRHPNYLGEILCWLGVFVTGVPSFGSNILAWVASAAGLYGITSIMKMATARLEGQQKEKYSGQEKYDTWTNKVKAPLVPFLG